MQSNAQAVEMWKVRPAYAVMMDLNAQKQWLAGEAPPWEHYRNFEKAMEKQRRNNDKNYIRNVESAPSLCCNDAS